MNKHSEIINNLLAYKPCGEQEEKDRKLMLHCLETMPDVLTRDNRLCHFTVSAWVVNKERTKVLFAFHNIYNSWAWLGGHTDGETNLLKVAIRESREESGIEKVFPVTEEIYSVEVLTVDGHIKRGEYVSSHLHLNVTYLLEADENEPISAKHDENSAVQWIALEEINEKSTEQWFKDNIYKKLTEKLKAFDCEE